jgi:hypothetical protein
MQEFAVTDCTHVQQAQHLVSICLGTTELLHMRRDTSHGRVNRHSSFRASHQGEA